MGDTSNDKKARRRNARLAIDPNIRKLLVIPMVAALLGAITTIAGELVLANEKVKDIGFSITLLAAGFYFFLRFVGRVKNKPGQNTAAETNESGGDEAR